MLYNLIKREVSARCAPLSKLNPTGLRFQFDVPSHSQCLYNFVFRLSPLHSEINDPLQTQNWLIKVTNESQNLSEAYKLELQLLTKFAQMSQRNFRPVR